MDFSQSLHSILSLALRIIHIVENLDKGAVESWLVRTFLLCTELRKEWFWTFYCILGLPGKLDEKVLNKEDRAIVKAIYHGLEATYSQIESKSIKVYA